MRTPEECLDAWRYIRPYAEGIADDKKALGRLQGVPPQFARHACMSSVYVLTIETMQLICDC